MNHHGRRQKVPGASPVLSWSTYHGLDPVWTRIGQEGILKVGSNEEKLICLVAEFPNCAAGRFTRQSVQGTRKSA